MPSTFGGVLDEALQITSEAHQKRLVHRLIKEFEREARTDGVTALDLDNRKKAMVQELNNFITMKKERSSALDARRELTEAGSSSKSSQKAVTGEHDSIDCNKSHRRSTNAVSMLLE